MKKSKFITIYRVLRRLVVV